MKALLLLALFGAAACAQAQVYKCVDERGVTQYSDKPRPGCNGGPVDIRPIPSLSGTLSERGDDVARENADFNRRQNERERAATKEREVQQAHCTSLRREQARLSSGRRLAQLNARGETVYLSDEARDQRLGQLREALRGCP